MLTALCLEDSPDHRLGLGVGRERERVILKASDPRDSSDQMVWK